MKKLFKSRIMLGVAMLLALGLVTGGLFFSSASAQGPGQGGFLPNAQHDNQAVLDLLTSTETELLQLRQSGKSWLDIATAKEVSEAALLDALFAPMNARHALMAETYPQFNATQMTDLMRTQFTNDIRATQFGTMTDRHVLGGGGMMHQWNTGGVGGAMRGGGMMHQSNTNNFGGAMRGGGMMRGWNNLPNVTPEPAR